MSQSYTNRLANETSPYLLQHAHNPVHWYPWGTEALDKAKTEDKPILLSIGYSACHWCHVMERESFENAEIAKQMNESFICIKVDREERPDLDSIYMSATVAMNNGHGGWPMTVFLTPDQAPFFAGTYFPPHDAHGRPGFPRILQSIQRAWSNDRAAVLDQSDDLVRFLKQESGKSSVRLVGETQISQAVQALHQGFDTTHGGFSPAPKFPAAASISLLLRFHHTTNNPTALNMADHTLSMMAKGGIYDHIGGGFARYSVDEKWLVPHFEKMLYDNALLIRSYVEGWQITQNPTYLAVVKETLDFTIREMTGPEGGFYSALDADSEGEEGKFYVWTPAQIREVLDSKNAELFCTAFDISEEGNFEGANIAHPVQSHEDLAKQFAMETTDVRQALGDSKVRLLEAREKRVRPGTDDKVITAWNGMMIGAMALGYQITGDKRYLLAAQKAADFIHTNLTKESELLRTWRAGKAQLRAYLEDYAYLAEGLLDLYEAGGGFQYLSRAQALANQILEKFSGPHGGALFSTAHDHEDLIVRKKEGYDGATPSENAVAANLFARLAQHFQDEKCKETAIGIIEAFGEDIGKMPRAFCKTLQAADTLLSVPTEIVFCGPAHSSLGQELRQTFYATYLPHRVIAHQETDTAHPLLQGRDKTATETVFVCQNFTCLEPATSPDELEEQLRRQLGESHRKVAMTTPLEGKATTEATQHYVERYGIRHRSLGTSGLQASCIGYGSYRIDEDNSDHTQSLHKALTSGINVIDTSTNYTTGSSERLIGRTLRQMIKDGELKREEVIVISKAGFLQGNALKRMRARVSVGNAPEQIVEYSDNCWHCIHPDFIDEELTQSLGRLGLKTIDAYLLHNPEYFLLNVQRVGGGTRPQILAQFYERVESAFTCLEQAVQQGRIQSYGVSSNTITDSADLLPTLNLERLIEIAVKVGGDNHKFRVIQCPLNLLEPAAALSPRENGKTILAMAEDANLAVLTNRPLNAILGGGLIRLAEPGEANQAIDPAENILKLTALEKRLRQELNVEIDTRGETIEVAYFFHWADEFNEIKHKFRNLVEWEDFLLGLINPRLNQSTNFLSHHLKDEHAKIWQKIFPDYRQAIENVCQDFRLLAIERSHEETSVIRAVLDDHLPAKTSLSQIAIQTAISTAGVTCVLNGMRQPLYVEDALKASQDVYGDITTTLFESLAPTSRQFKRRNINDGDEVIEQS